MNKSRRGPGRLAILTYQHIADWSGLTLHTVQDYAQRGLFDPRDLHATISWVNARRQRLGLPLIGQPHEPTGHLGNGTDDTDDEDEEAIMPVSQTTSSYNPLTGEFQ